MLTQVSHCSLYWLRYAPQRSLELYVADLYHTPLLTVCRHSISSCGKPVSEASSFCVALQSSNTVLFSLCRFWYNQSSRISNVLPDLLHYLMCLDESKVSSDHSFGDDLYPDIVVGVTIVEQAKCCSRVISVETDNYNRTSWLRKYLQKISN